MPHGLKRLHRNVFERRSREPLPDLLLASPVPTSSPFASTTNFAVAAAFTESVAPSQSAASESAGSPQNSADGAAGSVSVSETALPNASSALSSASATSLSSFSTTDSSKTAEETSSSQEIASSSSVATQSASPSSSSAAPSSSSSSSSHGRNSATKSATHVSGNFFRASSSTSPSLTASTAVVTPDDPAQAVAPPLDLPTSLSPTPSISPGSRQSGMNASEAESAAVTRKNVIVGVTSSFGGIAIVGVVLLLLWRLVYRRRKATAMARQEAWRHSADSWIGTRMGESRAATPAVASVYGAVDHGRAGIGAYSTGQMQQTNMAMVSESLGRFVEPTVQFPAPSLSPDRDSVSLYTAVSPPGSSTALIFSEPQSSELSYLDHLSPQTPLPVIRVTDPGAEYSRPPTAMSSLSYDSMPSQPLDTQHNPFSISLDTTIRHDTYAPSQGVQNSSVSGASFTAEIPTATLETPVATQNPFLRMTSYRDSASSYAPTVNSPSELFRTEDPFSDFVLGRRSVQSVETPVVSIRDTMASFQGDVIHPASPADNTHRFHNLLLTDGDVSPGGISPQLFSPSDESLQSSTPGPNSSKGFSFWK